MQRQVGVTSGGQRWNEKAARGGGIGILHKTELQKFSLRRANVWFPLLSEVREAGLQVRDKGCCAITKHVLFCCGWMSFRQVAATCHPPLPPAGRCMHAGAAPFSDHLPPSDGTSELYEVKDETCHFACVLSLSGNVPRPVKLSSNSIRPPLLLGNWLCIPSETKVATEW